ncbi:MAG TPA: DUF6438 domain-containing protein [Flavobacteriales bacterium]|nr:DUF6438 domain-containing protein [Flavobacteriales bacterium]
MQKQSLYIAALVLAFGAACKSRKDLPPGADAPVGQAVQPASPATETSVPHGEQKAATDSVYFYMERTPCYGTCPSYRLTIRRDGSALYEGGRFAPREGRYAAHVDAAMMEALAQAVEKSGFYAMDDVYDMPITDLPSTIIRMHADARDKKVVGRVGAPIAFRNLGIELEELLAGIEWTRVADEE